MEIQDKAAVVTGASRGVGRETAIALAKQGCSVLINYHSSENEANEVAAKAESFGVKAITFQGDVSDDKVCRSMMDTAAKAFGKLNLVVNNAGTTEFIEHSRLNDVPDELWDRIFSVNVKGPFQCVRAARAHLEVAGGGEIINVSSIAGIAATGSSIPYCASKAALINMTISLARALGPNIRVNSVAPGFIAGDWTQRGLGKEYAKTRDNAGKNAALGRVCLPEDVAQAILSVVTGSDMVTGQTIVCDGGTLVGT